MPDTYSPKRISVRRRFVHLMFRYFYSIIIIVLLPLIIFAYRKKLTHNDALNGRSFKERFGLLPKSFQANGIHIHCVSVGEVNASIGLIKQMQIDYPELVITVTTSSTTGAVHAKNMLGESVQHCYLPFDIPFCIYLFYRRIQPKLVLVTEVEVWPNLMAYCYKNNIPTILTNARMSFKSLKKYKKLKWLFRPTFRQFNVICAQSSESFNNFVAFGVYKKQLKLSNNMKFDLTLDSRDVELGQALQAKLNPNLRPVFLAASTHEPEEKIILDAFKKLKECIPELMLFIVPRHPQRFEDVHQIIKATGTKVIRHSKTKHSFKSDDWDCVLIDAMGKLKACYSICNLAFVGGSFAKKGGHNALEAALFSKPAIMGPSIFNNPSICEILKEKDALAVLKNESELLGIAKEWLLNADLSKELGAKGKNVIAENAGAIEKTMQIIRSVMQ